MPLRDGGMPLCTWRGMPLRVAEHTSDVKAGTCLYVNAGGATCDGGPYHYVKAEISGWGNFFPQIGFSATLLDLTGNSAC